jgi:hypothetical protein
MWPVGVADEPLFVTYCMLCGYAGCGFIGLIGEAGIRGHPIGTL